VNSGKGGFSSAPLPWELSGRLTQQVRAVPSHPAGAVASSRELRSQGIVANVVSGVSSFEKLGMTTCCHRVRRNPCRSVDAETAARALQRQGDSLAVSARRWRALAVLESTVSGEGACSSAAVTGCLLRTPCQRTPRFRLWACSYLARLRGSPGSELISVIW